MGKLNCTSDEELNKIVLEKHNLIRQYERKEIDDISYIEKLKKLEQEQKKRIYEVINNKIEMIKKWEENKMVESKKEEKEKVSGRKINENSNAQLILKALQMASIKTYDDVAKKVKELKPESNEARIKSMTKTMVREIVAGKGGKAKRFKWNEADFLLVENK